MKKVFLTLALSVFASSFASAETITYANSEGCQIEVENRRNGMVLYISADGDQEIIGVTHDRTKGSFAYCADQALQVHSYAGSAGELIMLSCSAHKNDRATTRGRADIEFIGEELKSVRLEGHVKKMFGWKKDAQINCVDLERQ
ncbi:MAG: hypothetical protein OM95_03495 [Bdellovibrio sp. ArHS]|uniref:hypothetical protein n=1 Tax=Bdellovibrio sp. ArHS TaxID=1569284 RepID=UPI000583F5C9|nr:hypothetical protein [Bdellovibrio sp. ArHS]KHD89440.1 MAG: hypothetical protein OM95_03495 [Bdellovibrio sp. ArHS]